MCNTNETRNRNKNQHYVPQYYFRFFSPDGNSIRILLRKNGRVTPPAAIHSQSSGDYFYGDQSVENDITNYDTKYSYNHRIIIECLENGTGNISEECIKVLIENILFQHERTLSHRESETNIHGFYRDFLTPQIEDLKNDDPELSEEANQALQTAMGLMSEALSDQRYMQYASLTQVLQKTQSISDLTLCFLKNSTDRPFVFSDSPVVYSNFALRCYRCSKLGEINLGLQIFFPLNASWLAFLYDPEAYQLNGDSDFMVFDLKNENDVHEINKLQLHESFSSVYFGSEKHEAYLEKLWKDANPSQEKGRKSIEQLPELTLDGIPTGRHVFSTSEPEPTFFPSLSFLKCKDLSQSHIPYRKAYIASFSTHDAPATNLNALIDKFPD
ncbi:DUF4238 domain-containing protein [Paludibacterium purpuratum]|uniref:Uncharacterized protein DUF4238 n=1 Tax=Paludibacterium purpuratum TaxID=1144873 RepID=A0A4R7B1N8_9NEIS|nr:DUF4238 domain-containing protein [Paludibacterium purpuratum]TDR73356.1 uncharacterized protein DUF4238 [Paludibacterium purpuratum]